MQCEQRDARTEREDALLDFPELHHGTAVRAVIAVNVTGRLPPQGLPPVGAAAALGGDPPRGDVRRHRPALQSRQLLVQLYAQPGVATWHGSRPLCADARTVVSAVKSPAAQNLAVRLRR